MLCAYSLQEEHRENRAGGSAHHLFKNVDCLRLEYDRMSLNQLAFLFIMAAFLGNGKPVGAAPLMKNPGYAPA